MLLHPSKNLPRRVFIRAIDSNPDDWRIYWVCGMNYSGSRNHEYRLARSPGGPVVRVCFAAEPGVIVKSSGEYIRAMEH